MSSIRKVCVAAVLATVASQEADAIRLQGRGIMKRILGRNKNSNKRDKLSVDVGIPGSPTVQPARISTVEEQNLTLKELKALEEKRNAEADGIDEKINEQKLQAKQLMETKLSEAKDKRESASEAAELAKQSKAQMEEKIRQAMEFQREIEEQIKELKANAKLYESKVEKCSASAGKLEKEGLAVKKSMESGPVKKSMESGAVHANNVRQEVSAINAMKQERAAALIQHNARNRLAVKNKAAALIQQNRKNRQEMLKMQKIAKAKVEQNKENLLALRSEETKFNKVFGFGKLFGLDQHSYPTNDEYPQALVDIKNKDEADKKQLLNNLKERYQALEAIYFARNLDERNVAWEEANFVALSTGEDIKDKLVKLRKQILLLNDVEDKVIIDAALDEVLKNRLNKKMRRFENERFDYDVYAKNEMEDKIKKYTKAFETVKKAVLKIQNQYRGHSARKVFKPVFEPVNAKRKAALKIQSQTRGFSARKAASELRALKNSAFEAFKNALAEAGLPDVEEGTLMKGFESMFHSTEEYEKIVSMVAAEKERADAAAAAADQARTHVESLQKELSIAQEKIAAAGEAKRITHNEIAALRTELSAAKKQNAALKSGDVDEVLYNLILQTEKLEKKLEEPSAHPKDLKQAQLHIASAVGIPFSTMRASRRH